MLNKRRFAKWATIIIAIVFSCSCEKEQVKTDYWDGVVYVSNDKTSARLVKLPNYSEATLNTSSELAFNTIFDVGTVDFHGQGYFKVNQYDPEFQINYKSINIAGSGAEFTVNTYFADEPLMHPDRKAGGVRLVVVRGSMMVTTNGHYAFVKDGGAVDIYPDSISTQIDWEPKEETGWLRARYDIKQMEMYKLARLISKQFNAEVTYYLSETDSIVRDIHIDLELPLSNLFHELTFYKKATADKKEIAGEEVWYLSVYKD